MHVSYGSGAVRSPARSSRAGRHIRLSPRVIRVMTPNAGGSSDMLEQIVYAAVYVSDQDRALDFYTNVLGLEPRTTTRRPTDRGS